MKLRYLQIASSICITCCHLGMSHPALASQTYSKMLTKEYVVTKKNVNGTIVDKDGNPLIGVTIFEKGTDNGCITDFNGQYQLSLSNRDAVIVISYVGYKTQELKGDQLVEKIVLEEDAVALDELVVVGYAVQKKKELTGSTSSLKASDKKLSVTTSLDQMMQGNLSGVNITNASGMPGGAVRVSIRGVGSINGSNEPLFVIDGIPVSNSDNSGVNGRFGGSVQNPLSMLNPNDIESIDVLKDAAATAIYGSRATNGVVMVTTKRGKKGQRTTVNLSASYGLQSLPKEIEMDFRDRPSTTEYDIITNSTGGWGNNYVHDKNVRRFGFGLGAPGNRIKNPDFKSGDPRSITNLPYIIDPAYYQRSLEIRQNKEADPRLYISAGQPYVDTMKDSKGKVTFYDRSPGMNNQPDILSWNHKKFTNREGFENQLNFSSPANYPIIRLADIYLLYAEVLKDSDPSTALEYINKIHRRAYDYPIDQPSPIDYTSLTDRTKAEPDDHLANDPLKYERWAELFAEGQWWFDIRRWEIGEQEMKYFKNNRNGSLIWRGIDCYVQPIPKTEIERYNGNIKQSGNY